VNRLSTLPRSVTLISLSSSIKFTLGASNLSAVGLNPICFLKSDPLLEVRLDVLIYLYLVYFNRFFTETD